jgi:hypothetical protein
MRAPSVDMQGKGLLMSSKFDRSVPAGMRQWCLRSIAVLAGLLIVPFLAPSPAFAGTLTLNPDGTVDWVGGVEVDTVTLTDEFGEYVMQNASSGIVVNNASAGRLDYCDTACPGGPGLRILQGPTTFRFDDLGGGNTYSVEAKPQFALVSIKNTSVGAGANDTINLTADESIGSNLLQLGNGGVSFLAAPLVPQSSVLVDYSVAKRASLSVTGSPFGSETTVDYSGSAGGLVGVTVRPQAIGLSSNDSVAVRGTAPGVPVSIDGAGGWDTVTIGNNGSLAGLGAPVTLLNGASTYDLVVDGSASASPQTVNVSSTEITGIAPSAIVYPADKLQTLAVNLGGGSNVVTVTSTPSSGSFVSATSVTGGGSVDQFNLPVDPNGTSTLALNGGGGASDRLSFAGRSSAIDVNFETGTANQAISFSNVEAMTGTPFGDTVSAGPVALSIDGGGGADTLVVNGTTAAETLEVLASGANTLISKTSGTPTQLTSTAMETIILNGGAGTDTLRIRTSQPGQTVQLNGGDGVDSILIGHNGSTKSIRGPVQVNGGSSGATMLVNDGGSVVDDAVTVAPGSVGAGASDTFFGAGGSLAYTDLTTLSLTTGTGRNTVSVSPSALTALVLNAITPDSAPGDSLDLVTNGLAGVNVTGTGANGTLQATGRQQVTFQGFEALTADGQTTNGTVALSDSAYSVPESVGAATIGLVRTGFAGRAVSVTVTPTNGTATAPGDFAATPLVVSFAPGQTTASVALPIVDDAAPEPTETVGLALSTSSAGAVLGPVQTATLSISNDDIMDCTPRPRVTQKLAVGGNALNVHIESTPLNAPANNLLRQVRFGAFQNATVNLNSQAVASGQTVVLAAGTVSVDFTVRRTEAGQPATVQLSVVDGCGEWKTFVGGGVAAGF